MHHNAGSAGRVFATENEPNKAAVARSNWAEAGNDVESVIELREGDLRETLKVDLPEVDLLLLDSKCFLPIPRGQSCGSTRTRRI